MRATAIMLALLVAACGTPAPRTAAPPTAKRARCAIVIDGNGILVDGDRMSRDHAVMACRQTTGALVELATDASLRAWRLLHRDLEAAGVRVRVRERNDRLEPCTNPLAAGCGI